MFYQSIIWLALEAWSVSTSFAHFPDWVGSVLQIDYFYVKKLCTCNLLDLVNLFNKMTLHIIDNQK